MLEILLEYSEWRLTAHFPEAHRLNDHGSDQARIGYWGERYKMSAGGKTLDEAARHLHRETGFTDAPWARDCNQADILTRQKFFGGSYFLLSPHEPGSLYWKICRARLKLPDWLLREAVAYGCKFSREISGGDIALIGLFRQAPLDKPTQRSGGIEVLQSHRFGLFAENGNHCLHCCASLKGALARHHLVKHQAE